MQSVGWETMFPKFEKQTNTNRISDQFCITSNISNVHKILSCK